MIRRIVLLIAVSVVLVGTLGLAQNNFQKVAAISQFERIDFQEGVVTASNLNLRQGASTEFPIVSVLKNGHTVQIFGRLSDWYTIYDPESGYVGAVSAQYVKHQEAAKEPKPAETNKPEEANAEPVTNEELNFEAKKPEETPEDTPVLTGISKEEQLLLSLINKERDNAGVEPLKLDMELMKVTRLKAEEMVEKSYFSHQSPTYGSPFDMMRKYHVDFNTAGENIAGNRSIEGAVKAWMSSEGHKKNILNEKFNYTGIGIVDSPAYGKLLVQHFIGK